MQTASEPYADSQHGIPATDFIYRLTERRGAERTGRSAARSNQKRKGGETNLISTTSAGKLIPFNAAQTGTPWNLRQRLDLFVVSTITSWLNLPSGVRLVIIISVTLLLGILIGLFVQGHRSPASSEPIWKSFSLSQ